MGLLPSWRVALCLACSLLEWPALHIAQAATVYPTATTHDYERSLLLTDNHRGEHFLSFVTRPDLNAPRWNIEVYNETAVTTGYWFVASYSSVAQDIPDGPWNAPHIYDDDGDLVWSGAELFDGWSTFDFRATTVQGQPMLSLIHPHTNAAVILNESYRLHRALLTGSDELDVDTWATDMHEFTTADNGTKALLFRRMRRDRSVKEFGMLGPDLPCTVIFDGIQEFDTKTWQPTHEWETEGHLLVNETHTTVPVHELCQQWDFAQMNSIDVFMDGDYLISSRRMSTIYRISRRTGSIIWRIGGRKSDFDLPVHFYGQHSVKLHESNNTHIVLSMFDNAYLPAGDPTTSNNHSRGLILALDTTKMNGELVREYPHPESTYTHSGGNMQMLPSGNAWLNWADNARSTEHAPDGSLIMQAWLKANISSYRTFKFPWVGRPFSPPDIHSAVVKKDDNYYTVVHMSWNGATEVDYWKIYRTTVADDHRVLVGTVKKQGFETLAWTEGWSSHVIVKAIDRHGSTLEMSGVFASLPPRGEGGSGSASDSDEDSAADDSGAVNLGFVNTVDEEEPTDDSSATVNESAPEPAIPAEMLQANSSLSTNSAIPGIFGMVIGCVLGYLVAISTSKHRVLSRIWPTWLTSLGRRKGRSYEFSALENEEEECAKLESFNNGVDSDE